MIRLVWVNKCNSYFKIQRRGIITNICERILVKFDHSRNFSLLNEEKLFSRRNSNGNVSDSYRLTSAFNIYKNFLVTSDHAHNLSLLQTKKDYSAKEILGEKREHPISTTNIHKSFLVASDYNRNFSFPSKDIFQETSDFTSTDFYNQYL